MVLGLRIWARFPTVSETGRSCKEHRVERALFGDPGPSYVMLNIDRRRGIAGRHPDAAPRELALSTLMLRSGWSGIIGNPKSAAGSRAIRKHRALDRGEMQC